MDAVDWIRVWQAEWLVRLVLSDEEATDFQL
jgi:hypothetical protein